MTKIALVGCGGWGKNLARNLAQLGVLAVVIDPATEAAGIAADLGVRHSSALEDALTDGSCTAVVIATPAHTHFDVAMRAIAARKHVFVEKPIALSVGEGQEMGRAARAAGLVLMVGHILQYHPAFRRLLELVRDGALGQLRHIISNRMSLGRLREEENVLWSFAPHDISMVCALAGSVPHRARAVGSAFLSDAVEDVTTAHIRFENGLTAEVRSSWCHPRKNQSLILVGSAAMAVFDDMRDWPEKLQLCTYSVDHTRNPAHLMRGEERFEPVTPGEPLKLEMQHFLDCIAQGRNPITNSAEALAVLAVLQATQASLKQDGAWINV